MKRPFGLNLELPRKGSSMTSVFDPTLGDFVLAEQMRGGKLVVHERLDAVAMLDIDLVREFCLRAGAAWTSSANLSAGEASQDQLERKEQVLWSCLRMRKRAATR